MSAGVRINGLDLGVAGRLLADPVTVTLARIDGWWDGAAADTSSETDTLAGRTGRIALNVEARTPAGLATALSALAQLVPVGVELTVALDATPDRVWRATRTSWQVTHGEGRQLRRRWARIEIGLGGDAAVAESAAACVVGIASTDAAPTTLPIGTLAVAPRIVITPGATGSCTDPSVLLYDLTGALVGSITLSGTITGSESLEIDAVRCGVWTRLAADGYTLVFAGHRRTDGDYFALDPDDGDRGQPIGPSVAVLCGSGSARALLVYPLRWDV